MKTLRIIWTSMEDRSLRKELSWNENLGRARKTVVYGSYRDS